MSLDLCLKQLNVVGLHKVFLRMQYIRLLVIFQFGIFQSCKFQSPFLQNCAPYQIVLFLRTS